MENTETLTPEATTPFVSRGATSEEIEFREEEERLRQEGKDRVAFPVVHLKSPVVMVEGDCPPTAIGSITYFDYKGGDVNGVTINITKGELVVGDFYHGSNHFVSLENFFYIVDSIGSESLKQTLAIRMKQFETDIGSRLLHVKFGNPTELKATLTPGQKTIYETLLRNRQKFIDFLSSSNLTFKLVE